MEMQYRRLGSSGLKVSALSLGAWVTYGGQVGQQVADECMAAAYEAGVNFFDNAEAYAEGQAEIVMGNTLKKMAWGRDTYLVSSKVFWGGNLPNQTGLSRKHVTEACHAALRRLQVDYLDLYFCHRPDPDTPVEETVRAMHDLITQGKVLYWGTSEWSAERYLQAWEFADSNNLYKPQMEQPQYNMFARDKVEKEFASQYDRTGMGTTIWSPLSSGLLTGKYNDGVPDGSRITLPGYEWLREMFENEEGKQRIEKCRRLADVAKDLDCSMAQMAIAWCLKNERVSTVITGASRGSQVTENMKALEVVDRLDEAAMSRIEEIL